MGLSESFKLVQSLIKQYHFGVESDGKLSGRIGDYVFGDEVLEEMEVLLGQFETTGKKNRFEFAQLIGESRAVVDDVFVEEIVDKILHLE